MVVDLLCAWMTPRTASRFLLAQGTGFFLFCAKDKLIRVSVLNAYLEQKNDEFCLSFEIFCDLKDGHKINKTQLTDTIKIGVPAYYADIPG